MSQRRLARRGFLASVAAFVVAAPGNGGVPPIAPRLGFPSAANPPVTPMTLPEGTAIGDTIKLYWSQSLTFSSGVSSGTHVLTSGETAGETITGFGIPTLSTGAPWYFRATIIRGGVETDPSPTVAWNDPTPPTMTSDPTPTVLELTQLAHVITYDKPMSSVLITGGDDAARFDNNDTPLLNWAGDGTESYDTPLDLNVDNDYEVEVTGTDLAGNTTVDMITVTVVAIDKTVSAFSFTDVLPATHGVDYTSNTITASGLQSGYAAPFTSTAPYSKNGAGFVAAGSGTLVNGDTMALKVTGGPGIVSGVLTIGAPGYTVSDSFDVNDGSAQWGTPGSFDCHGSIDTNGSPALNMVTDGGAGFAAHARLNRAAANLPFHIEFRLNSIASQFKWCAGIDDRTNDFSSSGNIPGQDDATGAYGCNNTFGIRANHAGTIVGVSNEAVEDDYVAMEVDATNISYIKKHGSNAPELMGTVAHGLSGDIFVWAGVFFSETVDLTVNTGGSAWAITPNTGYEGLY